MDKITYHVFGDTGGHYKQLKAGLEQIGWNPETHKLPENVIVIHTGDLIHKGPLSEAVLYLVDRTIKANPGRWIQIMGNHESQYTKYAPFFWGAVVDAEGQTILHEWIETGVFRIAYAIPAGEVAFHDLTLSAREYPVADKGVLFTHAGLPQVFWEKYILVNQYEPYSDEELFDAYNPTHVADFLNNMPLKLATNPGIMLGGSTIRRPVGPVWAAGVDELWKTWYKSEMEEPFHQVHGHTTPFSYTHNSWYPAHKEFKRNSKVNPERHTTVTQIAGSIHVAIDPGYNKAAFAGPQPALKITKG